MEERLAILMLKSGKQKEIINTEDFQIFSPQICQVLKGETNELTNRLVLKAEIEQIEEKDLKPEIQNCLKEIRKLNTKKRLDQISQQIGKAETEQDSSKVQELLQEFTKTLDKLN